MRTYARYATAGRQTVDIRYEPPPSRDGDPESGVYAACRGCHARHGPDGEHGTRLWAERHASQCK